MNVVRPASIIGAVVALAALVIVFVPTATASGGGRGCPAWGNPGGNPGMRDADLMTIDAAVQRSIAQITDAWYAVVGATKDQVVADRTAGMKAQDKNGDGMLCVAEIWGEELNPNAHWATYWGALLNPPETQVTVVFDNHMGTSKNT